MVLPLLEPDGLIQTLVPSLNSCIPLNKRPNGSVSQWLLCEMGILTVLSSEGYFKY